MTRIDLTQAPKDPEAFNSWLKQQSEIAEDEQKEAFANQETRKEWGFTGETPAEQRQIDINSQNGENKG